jgi:hypothetical protein
MTPISMGLALFLSLIFPGLGLWQVEYGKLQVLIGYVPGFFGLLLVGVLTFGLGLFIMPIVYASGLFHTWLAVRHHNRQAAKEAGIAQEFASLKEQVQNLSS